jgi:hypothetical protein
MTKKKIATIAVTALFILAALPGAVMNLTQPPIVAEMMTKLGLPLHILTLMGVWKLCGMAALAQPKFPRLTEWAYAGFFFDLTGAAYLHAAAGDFAGMPPSLVILTLLIGSYLLRNSSEPASASEPRPRAVSAPAMA